jgi:DNA polymerase-3 subunit epsilon
MEELIAETLVEAVEQAVQQWEQADLLAGLAQPASAEPERSGPDAVALRPPAVPEDSALKVEDKPLETMSVSFQGKGRRAPAVSLPEFTSPAASSPSPVLERLLILDTETTALHPEDGDCIEVGAVLFQVASRAVLTQVSFLLPCQENGAEAINGIPAAVSRLPQPWQEAMRCFMAMVAAADAILAHNAAFDRQWFGRGALPAIDKPWICSMEDIRWPSEKHLRAAPSVRDLAIAHGVPVWAAHRALTDCTYLVQVLERCDDLEGLLRQACEPRRLYQAQLSYSERHQAKQAGFRWNDPVPGAWSKRLSEREVAALPFPVHPVVRDG